MTWDDAAAPLRRILLLGMLGGAGALLGACGDEAPDDGVDELPGLVVSDPVGVEEVQGVRLASLVDGLVYVSLPPGSVPDGERVDIRNTRGGGVVSAPMVNGGFDPVAVNAVESDLLQILIRRSGGLPTIVVLQAVRARRPPVLVRTEPPVGRRNVPLNSRLEFVFTEPIGSGALADTSVRLSLGDRTVEGTLTFADDRHLGVYFTPTVPLTPGATYSLRVTQAVRDRDGEPLTAPVTLDFSTTPPEIVSVRYERLTESIGTKPWFDFRIDGTLTLTYLEPLGYRGGYARLDSVITMVFTDSNTAGNWEAKAIVRGDSLVVDFNLVMDLADFEDGIFVRISPMPPWFLRAQRSEGIELFGLKSSSGTSR